MPLPTTVIPSGVIVRTDASGLVSPLARKDLCSSVSQRAIVSFLDRAQADGHDRRPFRGRYLPRDCPAICSVSDGAPSDLHVWRTEGKAAAKEFDLLRIGQEP